MLVVDVDIMPSISSIVDRRRNERRPFSAGMMLDIMGSLRGMPLMVLLLSNYLDLPLRSVETTTINHCYFSLVVEVLLWVYVEATFEVL